MGLFDQLPPEVPSELDDAPAVLFTADQVADAVAAALEAHAAGDDPREAARAAVSGD